MARQYKRVFKFFPVWNTKEEINYLNKASASGWQLIHSRFGYRFKYNPDIRYRYQSDFPGKIEDMGRYLEIFREQGWEYVSSCKGWNYFRKPYDPTLPESEYEIFTDRASLDERSLHWIKGIAILAACTGVSFVALLIRYILTPNWVTLVPCITLAADVAMVAFAMYAMKKTDKHHPISVGRTMIALLILLAVIAGISSVYLTNNRGYFQCSYASEETAAISNDLDHALEWTNIEFSYTDNYYLDLEIEAENPVRFTIQNDAGDVVYEAAGADISEENIKLKLDAGLYSVQLSDFSGGELNVYLNID